MKTISLPNDIFIPQIKDLIDEGHTATFHVRGFSMRIFVEDRRDKVLLGPCNEKPKVGDVILAKACLCGATPDEIISAPHYVLHRIIQIGGNKIILRGDGNPYQREACIPRQILAEATCVRRGRHLITQGSRQKPDLVTGLKWRIYSRVWIFLTPVRRWILAAYRHIWLRLFPIKIE